MNNRLVVISSRLPMTLKKVGDQWKAETSSGGLATAMGPLLEKTGGLWIGWSGASGRESDLADPARMRALEQITSRHGYHPVDLPGSIARGFYEGFSNGVLWPLFHQFPMSVHFDPRDWESYVEANRQFAEAAIERIRPGDLVWVHDYQLMLVPKMIREAVPDARIGYFHHIPFPSSSIYRILPRRAELLEGLLGADVVAFHTYPYLQHFRASLLRILGVESHMDSIEYESRLISLDALPIGIAPKDFTDLLDHDAATARRLAEIRLRFAGRRLLLGVDRLDYTKGIPHRLRTFRKLLEMNPELRGRATLVQVAVPSRERVSSYKHLRREVDQLIGEINGEYATPDWTPVVYIRRGIPRRELVALYAAAEVALVTPLRDGLNLVAKEYVACKRGGDGALVLSEFAGAASEMGEAFLVNPYDEEQSAETIARVLAMAPEDRAERMQALYKRVTRNDVFAWSERFLSALRGDGRARVGRLPGTPVTLPIAEVTTAFARAGSRMLLLDYDGTLVGYASRPQDAVPSRELLDVLTRLAADPTTVAAVVSGRSRNDLDRWFSGVRGLWLFAEHGALMREPDGEWRLPDPGITTDWKARVQPVLEHYVDRVPGSFVEEKEFSLVFHYRMADPMFGEWLANELVSTLDQMLADTELRAMRGQKSVEVRMIRANKGEVLALLSEACPRPDFRLAAGDDRTDEDLFAKLADSAWTIHVGKNNSRARYRLANPLEMLGLLRRLAETPKAAAERRAS